MKKTFFFFLIFFSSMMVFGQKDFMLSMKKEVKFLQGAHAGETQILNLSFYARGKNVKVIVDNNNNIVETYYNVEGNWKKSVTIHERKFLISDIAEIMNGDFRPQEEIKVIESNNPIPNKTKLLDLVCDEYSNIIEQEDMQIKQTVLAATVDLSKEHKAILSKIFTADLFNIIAVEEGKIPVKIEIYSPLAETKYELTNLQYAKWNDDFFIFDNEADKTLTQSEFWNEFMNH